MVKRRRRPLRPHDLSNSPSMPVMMSSLIICRSADTSKSFLPNMNDSSTSNRIWSVLLLPSVFISRKRRPKVFHLCNATSGTVLNTQDKILTANSNCRSADSKDSINPATKTSTNVSSPRNHVLRGTDIPHKWPCGVTIPPDEACKISNARFCLSLFAAVATAAATGWKRLRIVVETDFHSSTPVKINLLSQYGISRNNAFMKRPKPLISVLSPELSNASFPIWRSVHNAFTTVLYKPDVFLWDDLTIELCWSHLFHGSTEMKSARHSMVRATAVVSITCRCIAILLRRTTIDGRYDDATVGVVPRRIVLLLWFAPSITSFHPSPVISFG
mmetsp:Transcript_18152/g.50524  ORF Transcript_18152/g.50524 Transcript_18152/m.50524 type:complete len:330 (-) Transcript_18152:1318-2307(-)